MYPKHLPAGPSAAGPSVLSFRGLVAALQRPHSRAKIVSGKAEEESCFDSKPKTPPLDDHSARLLVPGLTMHGDVVRL